jgi:nitrate reductase beta subunit
MLDPHDPEVQQAARSEGMPEEWLDAARKSPVYALAKQYRIALPLHPEYRTMPMVWYVPPLSPVVDAVARTGSDGEDANNLFGALESLRIPIAYLAELFTAGDTVVVEGALRKLAAMRSYMRDVNLGRPTRPEIAAEVGMTEEQLYEMFRLLGIAKYEDRYVIPSAYEVPGHLRGQLEETGCSLDYDGGPGMYMTGSGPFGEASGTPVPVAVETFHALKDRATAERSADGSSLAGRVNLLNWDGQALPPEAFPPRADGDAR